MGIFGRVVRLLALGMSKKAESKSELDHSAIKWLNGGKAGGKSSFTFCAVLEAAVSL